MKWMQSERCFSSQYCSRLMYSPNCGVCQLRRGLPSSTYVRCGAIAASHMAFSLMIIMHLDRKIAVEMFCQVK